ncbi:QueT transporter family protein [Pallidibacillus pasinlerensis]|uniref:QueT transporter family protein n=1 Tax=Pallidibacillus pasinlerensis TaxID=2703818 RepID=A0ABX0A8B4_9BACI|nr:QueT transporter family protein [Pallidibacillus pasinlerensis]NCU17695.1 QueT transporter family protein [Pallidibacillus pasinlerensis]
MNIRTISISGIVAALYIAVTFLVQPLAFGAVQLRLSEMFNHLIVFNKKYFYGIVIGVFLANLLLSPMKVLDITFGVAHTAISLAIVIFLGKYVKNIWARMVLNSLVFSFMIFIVAWELKIAFGTPFFETWGVLILGEIAVMLITMPIMYAIHKGVHFDKLFKK